MFSGTAHGFSVLLGTDIQPMHCTMWWPRKPQILPIVTSVKDVWSTIHVMW